MLQCYDEVSVGTLLVDGRHAVTGRGEVPGSAKSQALLCASEVTTLRPKLDTRRDKPQRVPCLLRDIGYDAKSTKA
jgi:hypothetical protein